MNDQTNEVAPKKDKTIVHPGVNPFPRENWFTTQPGGKKGTKEKYEIFLYKPIYNGDLDVYLKEWEEHHGVKTLEDVADLALRNLSTKPQFKTCFNEDGTLPEGGHAAMQTLMNEYKVGQRSVVTSGIKVKAAKLDALEIKLATLGMTLDEFMAKTAEA